MNNLTRLALVFLALAFATAGRAQTYTFSTLAGAAGAMGSSDGAGSSARFNRPGGVVVDSSGNVFVGDLDNHVIRKITPAGVVTTFAGSAGSAGSADGVGSGARFNTPFGLAFDGAGNLFVADLNNNTIRKISANGTVTTLAGAAGSGGRVDGTGSAARFNAPVGLAVDANGNVFVADTQNQTIRKITSGGVVTTIAGTGGSVGTADGVGAAARFNNPYGIVVDPSGNLFVSDTSNHTIRMITAGGVVTTVAGQAGNGGNGDGAGTLARFNLPTGLALDASANLFVADFNNVLIRRINLGGVVSTVAGSAGASGSADGAGGAARFLNPFGVAVDSSGNIFVADSGNHTIRKGVPVAAPTITTQPASQTVSAGGMATFTVIAAGAATLTYQWRKGGVNLANQGTISGVTTATLTLTAAQASDAGDYTVVVTNSVGSAASNSTTLTVTAATLATVTTTLPSAITATSATLGGNVTADGGAPVTQRGVVYGIEFNPTTANATIVTSGTGTGSFAVTSGTLVQNTSYYVRAFAVNSVGTAYGAQFGLFTSAPPAVTTQPSNQSVAAGSSATFTVVASGSETLGYRWRKGGVILVDGGSVSGATTPTLTITGAQTADAGSYDVVVNNSVGTARSTAATLTVNSAVGLPAITTPPTSQSVTAAANASFSVTASGTTPLTYQWRKGGVNLANQGTISGVTTATLTLTNVQTSDAGSYDVVLTNSAGNATSAPATLVVSLAAVAPVVTNPPASQSISAGSSVTFGVTATGTSPFTYQWSKDGTAISGATSATLTLISVQPGNAGSYAVVLSNSQGSVTSSAATLTVNVAPTIDSQPQSQTVSPGSLASFSVGATGTAPLSYRWFKDGLAIGGATSAALSVSAAQTSNAGNYTVVVTNAAGSITSSAAELTVISGVRPTITAQPSDQSVATGVTATFAVGVTGTSPFTYQWRLNGAAIPGATNNPLTLPNVSAANAGSYTVVVTNSAGSVTGSAAILTVVSGVFIEKQPVDQSVVPGSNPVFSVTAGGAPPLRYQWSKDGTALVGQNNAILSLTNVGNNDAGSYSVAVSNAVGTTTSRLATLVITPPLSKIVNMSMRSFAGAGSDTLIMGFAIAGQGTAKTVLVRGIGPTLGSFGVGGFLADPELKLYGGGSILLLSNNDWSVPSTAGDALATLFASTGAFTLNPSSKDAALRSVVQPGAYTAQVSSSGATGIALVELYDADISTLTPPNSVPQGPRLSNVSARSRVGTGEGVLIVGFVVRGNAPIRVLVRGIGPTLAVFGVPVSEVLADPQLVLLKGDSEVIQTNDDWWKGGGAQELPKEFVAAGAFALTNGTADAALVATLQPGTYNAKVSGAGNTTGVALVEVYELP